MNPADGVRGLSLLASPETSSAGRRVPMRRPAPGERARGSGNLPDRRRVWGRSIHWNRLPRANYTAKPRAEEKAKTYMSTENGAVDWVAALAEIEAEIVRLQAAADVIRERIARGGGSPTRPSGPGGGVRSDTFLKMSIPDATKKLLEITREKQSTQAVMDALEKGGLPPSKYNTVYSILSRRAKLVGDIINMKGDWALAEWYPNYRKGKAKDAENNADEKGTKKDTEKATA